MGKRTPTKWVCLFILAFDAYAVTLLLGCYVPDFAEIYRPFGGMLPLPTVLILDASDFMQAWWPAAITLTNAVIGCLAIWEKRCAACRSPEAERRMDELALVASLVLAAMGALAVFFIAVYVPFVFSFPEGDVISGT